jgi:sterol 3beta-glucosyltransferase
MKIALSTLGTRGDVQPFVSIALGLMERGHEVTLGVPVNLFSFAEKCGVRVVKLSLDTQEFLESPQGRSWLSSGNIQKFMKEMGALTTAHRDVLIDDYQQLCSGAQLLVTGVLTEDFVSTIAEAQKLPMLSVHFNPMRFNSTYANGLVATRTLPSFLNRATHSLADFAWWAAYKDNVNYFRAKVGLPLTKISTSKRLASAGAKTLHAFSPNIVPPPAEYKDAMPVVGAIHFPNSARERLGESTRDAELAAWLKAGTPPVFFGMGSMPVEDPVAMLRTITEVSKNLGIRALVGAGWSRFEAASQLPEAVRIVGATDHGWLLPQCLAAVHHGGAGTVSAVLSAGLPAVVTSIFADQPFWGAQLERLGVAVHLPFKKLRQQSLEQALRRVIDPSMQSAAKKLGEVVRAEPDATPQIIEHIESPGKA